MSQVSLTPIPVDGGTIVDLSTAGYCQMGNGQYFVVYAQINPNHVFGCLYTVTGEGTSSPSITIQKTQSIAGIAPSTTSASQLSFRVAKLNDDTVAILVQGGTSANVYPIRIDADDDNNMYQVDDEYTVSSIASPAYMTMMFEQVAENKVAFGWTEFSPTGDSYMYCRLDKLSFNTSNDTMSRIQMSLPGSGKFMETQDRPYGWIGLKEVKTSPGTFYITYYLNYSSSISQSNGYMIFRSDFSGGQVYDVMARTGGNPQDGDLGDLMNSLPIAYSTSDWYMVGEGVGYVHGGSSSNSVQDERSFASDIVRDYRLDSSYLEWHQLGNDDEKTMIYIHANHGTSSGTDQWSDNSVKHPYTYKLRVLKPGTGTTLICSPSTSNAITFSTGSSVTPMTTQPESFYKISESLIGMVGIKNRTSSASHEIVMCYLKF